jgi:hypothetical protein
VCDITGSKLNANNIVNEFIKSLMKSKKKSECNAWFPYKEQSEDLRILKTKYEGVPRYFTVSQYIVY